MNINTILADVIKDNETDILDKWFKMQLSTVTLRKDLMKDNELRHQSQ